MGVKRCKTCNDILSSGADLKAGQCGACSYSTGGGGTSGSVTQDSNNYDEPPRTGQSTNTMMTDNAQDRKTGNNGLFRDRRRN